MRRRAWTPARRALPLVALAAAGAIGCEGTRVVKGCPATLPSRSPPVPGEDFTYGDRQLAVAFWRRGELVASRVNDGTSWGYVAADGSIRAKLGWWRGVPGRLTVQGERLDAQAPPLRASVPAGYGSTGFQATGLTFPTRGCWVVVGSVAGHEIEFVVRVTVRGRARGSGGRAARGACGARIGCPAAGPPTRSRGGRS
jgi:hypothetical protein